MVAKNFPFINPLFPVGLFLIWVVTWMMIPVSKWLVTIIAKPWSSAICKGSHNPILRGFTITMIINHLQVRLGMILQVGPWGHSVDLPKSEPPNLQEVGPSDGTSSSMDGRLQCHSISGASGPMVQREETHGLRNDERPGTFLPETNSEFTVYT